MEEKQSQEKTDTYGEHSLKRDKVRGKMSWIKKVNCREKRDILYLIKREERKNRTHNRKELSLNRSTGRFSPCLNPFLSRLA